MQDTHVYSQITEIRARVLLSCVNYDLTMCVRHEVCESDDRVPSRHTLQHVITAVFTATETQTHTTITDSTTFCITFKCHYNHSRVALPDQRNNSHNVYFTAAHTQKIQCSDCSLCCWSSHTCSSHSAVNTGALPGAWRTPTGSCLMIRLREMLWLTAKQNHTAKPHTRYSA